MAVVTLKTARSLAHIVAFAVALTGLECLAPAALAQSTATPQTGAKTTGTVPAGAATKLKDSKDAKDPKVKDTEAPVLTESSHVPFICAFVLTRKEQSVDTERPKRKDSEFCPKESKQVLFPDEGDIVVVVPADQFYVALKAMGDSDWLLSQNGKSMADAAPLDGKVQSEKEVQLRFQITAGKTQNSQDFWTSAYQRLVFQKSEKLLVAVGWKAIPQYFRPPLDEAGYGDTLFVADRGTISLALVYDVLVLTLFVWAMGFTDIFRVGARPVATGKRLGYSFAKVQWGVWTCLALMSAIFMWAVYGKLPDLSGSILQLSAVSTLTATVSFFMDANNPPKPRVSAGLLHDLLSGNNNEMQAHRFQALLVNFMLLSAAVVLIYRHLNYPEFPAAWLAMLGISNAGSLAGKQLLENQPSTASAQPISGGGGGGGGGAAPSPAPTQPVPKGPSV